MEDRKQRFIENLKATSGIICLACTNTGINRSTYYRWKEADAEFREQVEEVMEAQVDFVESKLLSAIKGGDTTAIIFYLKTKGRSRGYSEKIPPVPPKVEAKPDVSLQTLPGPEHDGTKITMAKRIRNKKNYIVKILKKQGKYTAELSMQVDIAAQLLVRTQILADEIFDDNHKVVNVEISREGNERESISPKEKLYMEFLQQSQSALKALGMNTDAKERKTDNDSFSDFMQEFKEESE